MRWFKQHSLAIIFVIMACTITYVISKSAETSDTKSLKNVSVLCQRTNASIKELNARVPVHRADTEGLLRFLEGAQKARQAAYKRDGNKSDKVAAHEYGNIIQYVAGAVSFNEITPLPCSYLFGE